MITYLDGIVGDGIGTTAGELSPPVVAPWPELRLAWPLPPPIISTTDYSPPRPRR